MPRWGFSLWGSITKSPTMVGEEDPVSKYFPWEIVEQSLQDPQLEQFQGVKEEYLVEAKSCPNCEAPPDELRWVYVQEAPQPSERPGAHSHREGYLLVCDKCHLQVDFFCERRR